MLIALYLFSLNRNSVEEQIAPSVSQRMSFCASGEE
jgi:hypothetical protein